MTQKLRALTVLADDLGSVLTTHTRAPILCYSSSRAYMADFHGLLQACGAHTYPQAHTYTL